MFLTEDPSWKASVTHNVFLETSKQCWEQVYIQSWSRRFKHLVRNNCSMCRNWSTWKVYCLFVKWSRIFVKPLGFAGSNIQCLSSPGAWEASGPAIAASFSGLKPESGSREAILVEFNVVNSRTNLPFGMILTTPLRVSQNMSKLPLKILGSFTFSASSILSMPLAKEHPFTDPASSSTAKCEGLTCWVSFHVFPTK